MRLIIFMLVAYVVLFTGVVNAYCQDSASSGVTVIGPVETKPAQRRPSEAKLSEEEEIVLIPKYYEITGNKIGDTQVSQEVSLPSEGVIMLVDAGLSRAFVIMRVGTNGKESLFLSTTPERAVGTRLSKGIYKVYPQDLDGAFALDKLTTKVQVQLAEDKKGQP
ncbi:MAG: hypothetical protein PHR73_01345 [Candidatus Omnitrophica bacterium]|nr:hypothetical protein [Candidatus Omnitrophota bacterium]